jgi:PAS domain S-box-containing protein
VIDGAVSSVLALFSGSVEKEDRGTVSALDTLASQIGQAMARERALDALRESEARKAAVLEAAIDAVVTIDHRGRILEFNPAAERMFGYAKHEALGKDMAELIVPSSLRDAHHRGLARYLATGEGPMLGKRVELPARRRDGSEFPAELAITRVSTSGDPVFTGFVRDMTKSAELIRALSAAEARQRVLAEVGAALVQSLDHGTALPRVAALLASELCDWCAIHLVDEPGELSQIAAAHREPAKTPLIERLWRRRPPSPDCEVGPARVTRTGSAQVITQLTESDIARIARDGEEARLLTELGAGSYLGVPLLARGATLGALSLVLEPGHRGFVAEDRELAGEIARRCATAIDNALLYREAQESLRARDDFLALAAHELSTPLTPLRMRVQELSRLVGQQAHDCPTSQQLEEGVRAIDRSSRRLGELVDRLLDVSRVTVGKVALERQRFDAVELAREVVGKLGEELDRAGSRITWRVPDEPVTVVWDRRRIQLALHNLLSNALKFGPGRPIEVSVSKEGEEVHVAVSDEGPGLTAEDRGRLFERFARVAPVRQYGGFGLGLWIVRQIAEEHGGRVEVWSEPGSGARFGLTLPRE